MSRMHFASKPHVAVWGVFHDRFKDGADLDNLLRRAWAKAQGQGFTPKRVKLSGGDVVDRYVIDTGEVVGFQEYHRNQRFQGSSGPLRHLVIDVSPGTANLFQAYPLRVSGDQDPQPYPDGGRTLALDRLQRTHIALHRGIERHVDPDDASKVFRGDPVELTLEAGRRIYGEHLTPIRYFREDDRRPGVLRARTAFLVDMGRIVGHSHRIIKGKPVEWPHSHILIEFNDNGQVITAFPHPVRLPGWITRNAATPAQGHGTVLGRWFSPERP
jgi:hypothetical protein